MTDFVFPEDVGTGAADGDFNDAANFASLAQAAGLKDYVVQGLSITLDAGTPSFDIGAGKAVVTDASATGEQSNETRDGVSFVAEIDARSNISLTDDDVNYVYLQADLSSDDTINIVVNTTGSKPSEPSLKIAEIDTSNDTVTEVNRTVDDSFIGPGSSASAGNILVSDGTDVQWYTDSDGIDAASGSVDVVVSDFAGSYTSDDGSNNVQVNIGTGLTGDGSNNIEIDQSFSPTWTSSHTFNGGMTVGSNIVFGSSSPEIRTNGGGSDSIVIKDANSSSKLVEHREGDSTIFYNGIDAGSIEAPEDSYTQIVNQKVTSSLNAGDQVGYTFALNNSTMFEIEGEADGSGGTQNTSVKIGSDLEDDAGNVVYSISNNWVPTSRLESDTVTVAGNSVSLGGSTGIDHTDIGGVQSDQHHSKYTDEEAQDASASMITGGTDISTTYDDANNTFTIDYTGTGGGGVDIQDSGSSVVSGATGINFANNLTVTDDSDGTVTVDASSGGGSSESVTTTSAGYTTSGETTVLVTSSGGIRNLSKDGFEDGDYTSNPTWEKTTDEGEISINGGISYDGAYSVEFGSFSTGGQAYLVYDHGSGRYVSGGGAITAWIYAYDLDYRGAMYILSNGDSSALGSGDAVEVQLRGDGDGMTIKTYDSGGSQIASSSENTTITTDEWLKLRVEPDLSNSTVSAYLENTSGTVVHSVTGVEYSGADSFRYSKLYGAAGSGATQFVFDEVTYDWDASTVTLSSSDASTSAKKIRVVDRDGNAGGGTPMLITTESSEAINGDNAAVLNTPHEGITFQSDGSNWYVVSHVVGGQTI